MTTPKIVKILNVAWSLFIHRHKPVQPSRLAPPKKIPRYVSRRCWLAWVELQGVQLAELPVKHRVPVREGLLPPCPCPCPCLCHNQCRCRCRCRCRIQLSKWSWSRRPVAELTHAKTRQQKARPRNITTRRARSTSNKGKKLGYVHAIRSTGVRASEVRSGDFMLVRQRRSSYYSLPNAGGPFSRFSWHVTLCDDKSVIN